MFSITLHLQVLAVRGVSPVRDRDLITTAGKELAEACDMTPEEMDEAAHHLMRTKQRNKDTQLPYFDHLSGYELRDYTQRSLQHRRDLRQLSREPTLTSNSSDDDDSDEQQEMVYVTTL